MNLLTLTFKTPESLVLSAAQRLLTHDDHDVRSVAKALIELTQSVKDEISKGNRTITIQR